MSHHYSSKEIADAAIAGGLLSSPAWSPSLAAINDMLLSLSLLLGVVIALVRLWLIFKDRQ